MTRPPATRTVLAYRAVGALTILVAYAALRAPFITTWTELGITLALGGAVVLFGLNALTELAVRDRDWLSPDEPSPLEITERIPMPLIAWPTHEPTTDELIYRARWREQVARGWVTVVDRGELIDTEPHLFTHEFNSAHTPPSGIPAGGVSDAVDALCHAVMSTTTAVRGRHAADREAKPSPVPRTARHALADAQLNRERAHGQFGVW